MKPTAAPSRSALSASRRFPARSARAGPDFSTSPLILFFSTETQRRAGLCSTGQEHFSELVPFHEVAHQWWGNIVGWSSYRDQWIDEAIANYLALLFADTRKNPDHTLRVWLQRYRQQLVEKAPSADEPAGDIGALALGFRLNSSKSPYAYEDVIYSKGAWVIHMLRANVAPARTAIPTRASTRCSTRSSLNTRTAPYPPRICGAKSKPS